MRHFFHRLEQIEQIVIVRRRKRFDIESREFYSAYNFSSATSSLRTLEEIIGTNLVVEKYKIHLYEDERHPGGRREGEHDVVALGVLLELEVLAELEARVDHGADPERDSAHPQIKTAVVLGRSDGSHVGARGVRGVAVAAGAARRTRRVQVANVLSFLFSYANLSQSVKINGILIRRASRPRLSMLRMILFSLFVTVFFFQR